MTQLGYHSAQEDFRNRIANLRIAAALTISISRNPEAHGPQDGIEPSAAEVFNRPQPATGETFSPLLTMLLQLLLHYGVLQTVHNLLRFLKIDSEVFRSRTKYRATLGERSLQFFRFRGPRCVGQRDLYPFAILFRELPVEHNEELIRRAMRWPDPLAEQVAQVVRRK
jgi:hypothetical protein